MNILLVSKEADGGGIAIALQEEGHKCKMLVSDPDMARSPIYQGLVERTHTMGRPDLAFADMVGNGGMCDVLRRQDVPVIGGGKVNDALELGRWYGLQVCKSCGIAVPESEYVKSFAAAKAAVKKLDGPCAVKFDGNQPCASSMVCDEPQDMLDWLDHQEAAKLTNAGKGVIVQRKVDGILVEIEAWWTGSRFVAHNLTMEEKKLMAGGFGPATGCSGNVVWACDAKMTLVQQTLAKLEPWLKAHRYCPGPLALNLIVDKQTHTAHFIEITSRLGYDAIYSFIELLPMPFGEFMYTVATDSSKNVKLRDGYSASVRCGIPPWPFGEPAKKTPAGKHASKLMLEEAKGVAVVGPIDEHVWLGDVMLQKDELVCAGTSGQLFSVTAVDKTPEEANTRCIEQAKEFSTPNLMCRIDCAKRVAKEKETLHTWGLTS